MKRFTITLMTIMMLLLAGCPRDTEESGDEASASSKSWISPSRNPEPVVLLAPETQMRMNLETSALAATDFSPEVRGYGRVLDPASLSSLVADYVSAQATADASQKELDRMRTLAAQDNASQRALEASAAAVARDQAAATADRQALLTHWGGDIAQRPDLQAFVQSLAAGETALVQITLPAGEDLSSPPVGARLVRLGGDDLEGQLIGPVPAVDPQMQGQGFLFLVTRAGPHLKPGAAVTGSLKLAGRPIPAVIVPESAVVRYLEQAWVYMQTDGTHFVRKQVLLTHAQANHDGWFITEGLKAGDRIVVHGAAALLSEELKSRIQLED